MKSLSEWTHHILSNDMSSPVYVMSRISFTKTIDFICDFYPGCSKMYNHWIILIDRALNDRYFQFCHSTIFSTYINLPVSQSFDFISHDIQGADPRFSKAAYFYTSYYIPRRRASSHCLDMQIVWDIYDNSNIFDNKKGVHAIQDPHLLIRN